MTVAASAVSDLLSLSVTTIFLPSAPPLALISSTVTVPSTATTIKLEGATNHSKATVSGLGNITLTGNETVATIKVTAEDGSVRIYSLNVTRSTASSKTDLKDITICLLYTSDAADEL